MLSTKEQSFLTTLKEITHDSIWGIAITNVINDPQAWKVRKLICELKSQASDNSEVMLNILGQPGYSQLQSL